MVRIILVKIFARLSAARRVCEFVEVFNTRKKTFKNFRTPKSLNGLVNFVFPKIRLSNFA